MLLKKHFCIVINSIKKKYNYKIISRILDEKNRHYTKSSNKIIK